MNIEKIKKYLITIGCIVAGIVSIILFMIFAHAGLSCIVFVFPLGVITHSAFERLWEEWYWKNTAPRILINIMILCVVLVGSYFVSDVFCKKLASISVEQEKEAENGERLPDYIISLEQALEFKGRTISAFCSVYGDKVNLSIDTMGGSIKCEELVDYNYYKDYVIVDAYHYYDEVSKKWYLENEKICKSCNWRDPQCDCDPAPKVHIDSIPPINSSFWDYYGMSFREYWDNRQQNSGDY